MGISYPATSLSPPPPTIPGPDPALSEKLSRQYGMAAGHQGSLVFRDPPDMSKMSTIAKQGATVLPFLANKEDSVVAAWWVDGGVVSVLAGSAGTGNSYVLVEETLPRGAGAAPHYFEDKDEVFYILEGAGRFLLDEKVEGFGEGDTVFVPRGRVSGFRVESEVMRCLHLTTPGGYDRFVELMAVRAEGTGLPPKGLGVKEVDGKLRERVLNEIGLHFLPMGDPLG
jgi:quercetin dioxygenase-like cupin family protein